AGVLLNLMFSAAIPAWENAGELLVRLPTAAEGGLFSAMTFPAFSLEVFQRPEIYRIAVTLAVVASIETLLCTEAMDTLDPVRRISDPNQELRAQGIGNMVAGLLGGLPMTAVIVRG